METVAEGSQDRRLWTQTHRQQRRLHEAVAADVESQNTRATTGRSVTAKYRLPSYSSYNEICLGRVNIATARGKLRRQAGSKMAYGSNSCGSELAIFMGFPTGSSLKKRAKTRQPRHEACGMRNVLAARLLLITVINLARQQIEIKRRQLGATRLGRRNGKIQKLHPARHSRRMQSERIVILCG